MKTFTTAAMDAIIAGEAIVSGAVFIDCSPQVRYWGGYGNLTIAGVTGAGTFLGLGDRGQAQVSGGSIGGEEQNITLTLSGIETAALALFDASLVRSAPIILYRLVFDKSATALLDAQIFAQGRLDALLQADQAGGSSTITATVESAARGMGRNGGRMSSDADQRLISGTDGGLRKVSFAGTKTLYWGGQKPNAPSSEPSISAYQPDSISNGNFGF